MSDQPVFCSCVRKTRPITDDYNLIPDYVETCPVCGGTRGMRVDDMRLFDPRRSTDLKALDLSVFTDPTVPACPGCESKDTVMMETTSGNWQMLCLACMKRWGSDWRPAKETDDGSR